MNLWTRLLLAAFTATTLMACSDSGGGASTQDGGVTLDADGGGLADAHGVVLDTTLMDTSLADADGVLLDTTLMDTALVDTTQDVEIAQLVPDTQDTDTQLPLEDTGSPGLPEGLTGEEPPVAQPLPSLAGVVDSTGAPVTSDQLLEHWSVLWFYPMATTAG